MRPFWRPCRKTSAETSKTAGLLHYHSGHPDHAFQTTVLKPSPTSTPCNARILKLKNSLLPLHRNWKWTCRGSTPFPQKYIWYLPIFGVYHPQKPGQIRVVFDWSAQQRGFSLNSVLLSGLELNNSLLGVLLRFRKELVALRANIQLMFYGFLVREDHRIYLRFLWHKDNDLAKEVAEYASACVWE